MSDHDKIAPYMQSIMRALDKSLHEMTGNQESVFAVLICSPNQTKTGSDIQWSMNTEDLPGFRLLLLEWLENLDEIVTPRKLQ